MGGGHFEKKKQIWLAYPFFKYQIFLNEILVHVNLEQNHKLLLMLHDLQINT
jgi:hypothetical protein